MYAATTEKEVETRVRELAPLVKRIAHHMMAALPPSVEIDDVIQSGMMGLLDAARRYQTSEGAQFETYAVQRIRGAMLDGLRQCDWLPRGVRRSLREAEKMISKLEQQNGRPPTEAELAKAMDMSLTDYQRLLQDDSFWLALTHSIVYLLVTPVLIFLSIGLAILVNRRLRGVSIYRALYFVPAVAGSIAIGLSWRFLFDRSGFVNAVLQWLGLIDEPIQWLATPGLVLPLAMLLTIWAGVGYYAVIFLAGLQNIPEEQYDAARIDGCNDWQTHRHVSLPGLRPQIVFVFVISSLAALKVFDEI